ncbi:MAG: hypothetical protein FWC61_03170 [Proteobacteria bacterium]|nr:hypothetical protein [Pseudomonadota bacterium]
MKSVKEIVLEQLKQELDVQIAAQKDEIETSRQFKGIMESHHDTYKQEAQAKSVVLGKRIGELESSIQTIKAMNGAGNNNMLKIFALAGETDMRIILAPVAARDYGDIRIVSANAPVGVALLGAAAGDTIKIGPNEFIVESIKDSVE